MGSASPDGAQAQRRLRLYVAGETPGARRALEARQCLLETLGQQVDIEVIDILARPEAAEAAGILATPTLSDDAAEPPRRLVGDISNAQMLLDYFGCR